MVGILQSEVKSATLLRHVVADISAVVDVIPLASIILHIAVCRVSLHRIIYCAVVAANAATAI